MSSWWHPSIKLLPKDDKCDYTLCEKIATHYIDHDSDCPWNEDETFCEEHANAVIIYFGRNSSCDPSIELLSENKY